MSDYKSAPPTERELEIMLEMALDTNYRATNLTSARLTSLEKRGYVERKPGRYKSYRPMWALTSAGREAVYAHVRQQDGGQIGGKGE